MTVLITLTTAGIDVGPFDLYSNLDGYVTPFETNVSKAALQAGYSSTLVPDYTKTVRVQSKGVCINYTDIVLETNYYAYDLIAGSNCASVCNQAKIEVPIPFDNSFGTFYSNCSPLVLNCILYIDQLLTQTAPEGFVSDGVNCYEIDPNGRIIVSSPCNTPCDLAIQSITSTDPTTVGGTDGTITIEFSTTNGPSTYTLNSVLQGTAVSPLIVTGLSSNIPYTIIITDNNNCSENVTLTLGQSAVFFDADWVMATYEFTNGLDLDTRTRMVFPDIGQDTQPKYLGWNCKGTADLVSPVLAYSETFGADPNQYVLLFGGDNTGIGFESVLINIERFKTQFPTATEFTIDLRGFWFNLLGSNPVNAAVTLWKGGAPLREGCKPAGNQQFYCWTNPTATATKLIDSVPKLVTLRPPDAERGDSSGERIATLRYGLNSSIVILDNSDITTPSV